MEKLKVAFYSDTFLPAVDGVVISILNFKKGLEAKGHKLFVFATGDPKTKAHFAKQNIFISRGMKFKPYPQYKLALFPYASGPKLLSKKVDIMHVQTPFMMGFAGLSLAKLSGMPVVGTYHTMITDKAIIESYYPKNKYLKKMAETSVWKYTSMFYNNCDVTIAPSTTIECFLHKHGIKNTAVVPNSVDVKRFKPSANTSYANKVFKARKGEKIVLYVGRLSKEKNVDVLLKAASILQKKGEKIKFIIGGTGPAEEHYRALAHKLNLHNTKFIGFVPHGKLPGMYARADAFCIPSTFETQGIVALEAMATGKAVIAADSLALAELILPGKNGELFKPGDYKTCARLITKVLNNSNSYRKKSIATANEFSIEKTTDMLLDVYRSILNK